MKRMLSIFCSILLVIMLVAACTPAGNDAPPADDPPAADDAPAADDTPAEEDEVPAEDDPPPADDPPAADDGPEPVEIRVAWWGDTVRNDLYGEILDGFEARYSHITLVREPAAWGDYWDRLAIQTAGGHAPDFVSMHPVFAADYIGRGVLAPLDPFVADGTIDLSGWQQGVIDTGVSDGTLYMLAMGVTFSSYFVNRGLFEEIGVPVPDMDWTWDDFMDTAWAVREAFDALGNSRAWLVGDMSGADISLRYWTRQHGQYIYDEDGNIGFTPEVIAELWEKYEYMIDNNLVPDGPTGSEFAGVTLEESMFARDMVLLASAPVNQFAMQRLTFPDKDMTIIRHPSMPGAPPHEFPEGAHFGVSGFAPPENQRAAAMLLNYWLNTSEALYLFRLDQGVPGNEALHYAFIDELTDDQMSILDFVNYIAPLSSPFNFHPRGAGEVNASFGFHAEQMRFGLMSPADAAAAFHAEAVEIIRGHQEDAAAE